MFGDIFTPFYRRSAKYVGIVVTSGENWYNTTFHVSIGSNLLKLSMGGPLLLSFGSCQFE